MPFASQKQRNYLHANEPEIAKRWEREAKQKGESPIQKIAKERQAKRRAQKG